MITRSITRPVTSPIARGINAAAAVWNPRALFALGEQGVHYDPNDLTTLFQDAAGTTPVTAAGQPVGLMLDKRLGLVWGPDLWVPTSVALGTGWTRNGDVFTTSGSGGNLSIGGLVVGRWYEFSAEISGGNLNLFIGNGNSQLNKSGQFTWRGVATGNDQVYIQNTSSGVKTVTAVSVRELPGNHAFQPTAASRPMLRDTPRRIDYDAVDDALNVTFLSALGSACTVARSIPGVGAQILTAQTIGTTFTDNVDNCGLIIINRALTPTETANLTRLLNQRAGV